MELSGLPLYKFSISQILQLLSIYRNAFHLWGSNTSKVIILKCACSPPEKNDECGLMFGVFLDVSRDTCYLMKIVAGESHNHDYLVSLKKCGLSLAESTGFSKRNGVVIVRSSNQNIDSTKTSKKRLSEDECVLPIPKRPKNTSPDHMSDNKNSNGSASNISDNIKNNPLKDGTNQQDIPNTKILQKKSKLSNAVIHNSDKGLSSEEEDAIVGDEIEASKITTAATPEPTSLMRNGTKKPDLKAWYEKSIPKT
ncbi:unnamed protein product [Ambrosiozyma monospora]|uniref:Unnamed protein product n=1 Tax=Ambrosiozyma monospora TaxID=43982 RepID=A0A9W6SXV5_AMBMO|nr:unnamed protein product [Ambrosiozyma monospora]